MVAWYPLVEKVADLAAVNDRFRCDDFELVEMALSGTASLQEADLH